METAMSRDANPTPGIEFLKPYRLAHADLSGRQEFAAILGDLDVIDDGRLSVVLADRFESAGDLFQASAALLSGIGLDSGAIARIARIQALTERLARETISRRPVISCWPSLVAYVRVAMAHRREEQFRVLYLDKKNRLLRDEFVADGTIDHAPVYPREVVRRALEAAASAMILVHNHPSGDPEPSQADIAMTRKVVDAARVFDILVHDHLVVGREGTASFRQLGLMP